MITNKGTKKKSARADTSNYLTCLSLGARKLLTTLPNYDRKKYDMINISEEAFTFTY